MTEKASRNQIISQYPYVYSCDFDALQHLFSFIAPSFENYGKYGLNFKCYSLNNGIAICTGYSNKPGIKIPAYICKRYDDLAIEVLKNNFHNTDMHRAMNILIKSFLKTLTTI